MFFLKRRKKIYRSVGLMSGTSYDGIDVGLIETDGFDKVKLLEARSVLYPKSIRDDLAAIINGDYTNLWLTEKTISELHSEIAYDFLKSVGDVDVIGFHGQTIFHNPANSISVQIGNPHILAVGLKKKVVYDFRRKDVAYGGQGAPLVPIFIKAIRPYNDPACFLNLGGVANICYVHMDDLIAFDTGPGNAPIDDFCRELFNKDYDNHGKLAAQGVPNLPLIERLVKDDYFHSSQPKSLDRNHFDFSMLRTLPPHDVLATIVEFVAHTVKLALTKFPKSPKEIIVSGGGAHNAYLLERIKDVANIQVVTSDKYKLPSEYLEAYAFAYLAVRSLLGEPISFPKTTGVGHPMTGGTVVSF
ncbi:MAG: anmK [Candidatus Midichloriaceae bacterium]|jgi:anhydro-N-acetylmuramic acid kinase|nr:anmK [Candidatus Midichloriaceae bacterium]